MNHKPSYRNVHNRFKLNGNSYSFDDLLEVAISYIKDGEPHQKEIGNFLLDWIDSKEDIVLQTSGSTATPKTARFPKQAMVNSALATGNHFNIKIGSKALNCLPAKYIAGKMMLVRAMILGLELDVVQPHGNVLAYNTHTYDFAAMVPLQVENSLSNLNQIGTLLIGGAATSTQLIQKLKTKKTKCFITYGMTETLTHIASMPITSKKSFFTTLADVQISVDERKCLCINVPYLNKDTIITNDLVTLESNSSFKLLGRVDSVINSGGVKIIPEVVEQKISSFMSTNFFIGSQPDKQLGQKVILVVESQKNKEDLIQQIKERNILNSYEIPKNVFYMKSFTYTENGKLMRSKTLELLFDRK